MIAGKFKTEKEVEEFVDELIKRILRGPFESGTLEEIVSFIKIHLTNNSGDRLDKYALIKLQKIENLVREFCQKMKGEITFRK